MSDELHRLMIEAIKRVPDLRDSNPCMFLNPELVPYAVAAGVIRDTGRTAKMGNETVRIFEYVPPEEGGP